LKNQKEKQVQVPAMLVFLNKIEIMDDKELLEIVQLVLEVVEVGEKSPQDCASRL
jgi:translation elongation factor EF-Tu-like GTPase